jgi:iron complex outermembrane receptor protein
MKRLLALVIFLASWTISFAQVNFSGRLIDKVTQQPIADANIYSTDLKKVTTSNTEGIFEFTNLPIGDFQLKISCVGYRDTSFIINITNERNYVKISLSPKDEKIPEVTVTADRKPKKLEDVTSRVDIISPKEVKSYPATNVDNFLQSIPNVYVNRSWGIFSKNSSVTMRGMDGTARVLVLLDGVPLNMAAGGGINWHLIESEQVERIEVLKGPASALYGNNAMGGVINIITKKGTEKLEAGASLFGGTYNTLGGRINLGNNLIDSNKGFYWSGNAFYRQGDGYVIVPEEDRDSNDVALAIKEYSLNLVTGYQFNKNHKLDFNYRFYDDKREEGIKIYEDEGSYLKYTTQHFKASYTGNINGLAIYANSFYHWQSYFQRSERLNEVGDSYKLYDRNQISKDFGIWINTVKEIFKNNELSVGLDYKHGNFWAEDLYFTSTDYVERGGDIDFYAIFAQNDLKLLNQKLILSVGLRADFSQFKNGYLNVEEPTSVTSFDAGLEESFHETKWSNISPKIALRYKFNPWFHTYASYSTGFMPPKIDDMVSSRKVSGGFKIANPDLKPETLTNYELGFDFYPTENMVINLSGYYSIGSDFQYFVGTGDTVDVDRAVVRRQNISKTEIYGFESSISYSPFEFLSLKANYTYNHSEIKEFDLSGYAGDDLTGKIISENPPHQFYFGAFFTNKIVDINLVTNYVSGMWQDELNTLKLEPYATIDISLRKELNKFTFSIDAQNILDKRFIDKKGGLSPGRFIIGKIGFKL